MEKLHQKTWLVYSPKVISFEVMKRGNRKSKNKSKPKNKNKNCRPEKSSVSTKMEESYESEYILAFIYLFLEDYDLVYLLM